MSRNNKNNNNNVSASASAPPVIGSLVVPSQYKVTELPYGHRAESNNPYDWAYPQKMDECDHMYQPPIESYEKYYADWKQYILQSKSDNNLSLPLSKILLRTLHEYMDHSPNKLGQGDYRPHNFEPSIDGPIAVLDGSRYFSLKEQNTFFFNHFSTPPRSHRSSWRHWLILYHDISERRQQKLFNPWKSMTLRCRFCPWTGETGHLPRPDSINCNLSSPFLADIKKMKKDGSGLVLRRFAITPPSSPPWASIIMAIDKRRGYLVYAGIVQREYQNDWIVLDSITNYATGDLLYFTKAASFYVLPDAQSGNLEQWTFQDRLLSNTKTWEMNAELFHNNNCSYPHIHSYLVESLNGKNLLLIRRNYVFNNDDDNLFQTNSFEVFKFDFMLEHWDVVLSLDNDEALFVGSNSSFALSSTKYPEVIPNSIYFTDQLNMPYGKDNGIFHLNDSTVTTLFNGEECNQPPTWLCPSAEWWPQHYRWPTMIGYARQF